MKRNPSIKNFPSKCSALFFGALVSLSGFIAVHAQEIDAGKSTDAANGSGAILEFLDGSSLHGQLRSVDSATGLKWIYPAAKQPIDFKPDNLAWIRFPNANASAAPNSEATCQFQFVNGDEFFGKLILLDEKELELQTWFGGQFKTPRAAVSSIRFFPKGAAAIYEGPTSLDGWQVGKGPSTNSWHYEDGALIGERAGTIGRDLKLPDASRVEFDLAWSAPFSLLFSFYTSQFEGFNYNSSSYMFYMTAGNISLQRINAGSGSTTVGRTEAIPAMLSKRQVHLEFRGNKEENFLELLADGKSIAQWKDNAGWVGKGSGILFYSQTDGGLKISNIKVSAWDGRPGREAATNAISDDQIFLANRDKVAGQIAALGDGKLKIATTGSALEIPLARISQIVFANSDTNGMARAPREIQASVSGGGTISFALKNWSNDRILGQTKNFGKISLNAKSIRQVQFNLNRSKTDSRDANPADAIIWEGNEP